MSSPPHSLAKRLVTKAFGDEPGGDAPVSDRGGRSLSMLSSSLSLIVGKVATMGLGFTFWLVAARTFEQGQVGLAAAAVSAVMLCTQLALLGVGSSLIVNYPAHARQPKALLDTAFSLIGLASLVAAGCFFALAVTLLPHLRIVAENPYFAVAFAVMSLLGTLGILLDQISAVLRRGDQMLARAIVFGVVNIALLVPLGIWSRSSGALTIFAAWVGAAFAMGVIGWIQLWRSPARYRYKPRIERRLAGPLLRAGLPNHWLTLTERAPGLILPIVVTEFVSPEANAAWYAAWMMAWVLYIIPIQVGMTLFAEASHKTAPLARLVRHGVRASLVLGVAGAIVIAAGAPLFLGILGPGYAAAGVTALRILVIAVVPLTFVQAYFIVCRSTGRLREAVITGVVSATLSIGCAAAAVPGGLTAMALAWLATQVVVSVWAVLRLWRLDSARRRGASVSPSMEPLIGPPDAALRSSITGRAQ